MSTIRLTMAQALVKYLQAQHIVIDGKEERIFGGMFAIFSHGNVAGLGDKPEYHRLIKKTIKSEIKCLT